MKRIVLAAAMAAFLVNGVLAVNVENGPQKAKTEQKATCKKADGKAKCAKDAKCAKAKKCAKKSCCKAAPAKKNAGKAGAPCCKAQK